MKRRNFLKAIPITTSLVGTSLLLESCDDGGNNNGGNNGNGDNGGNNGSGDNGGGGQPVTGLRIRKSLHTLSPNADEIIAYRDAVFQMKSRPASDPLSWDRQARIHQDHCSHGNWFFLPWHRAYLYCFEEIIRELSGMEDFALPYWDWSTFSQIPSTFWGGDNPLHDATRTITETSTADADFVGTAEIESILEITNFNVFGSSRNASGELEVTPHNYVHRFVRGNMVTMMSPLDPIFWCHHCNVDRLWAEWNHRGNQNPNDPQWRNENFAGHFFDTNGQVINEFTVEQTASTSALNYTYQSIQPEDLIADNNLGDVPEPQALASALAVNTRSLAPYAEVRLSLDDQSLNTIEEIVIADELHKKTNKRLTLKVSGIQPPKDENYIVRFFINCPYLGPDTPTNDPHYLTSVTFFGSHHEHGAGGHKIDYLFDITKDYHRIITGDVKSAKVLNVQVLALPIDGQGPSILLQPEKVELSTL